MTKYFIGLLLASVFLGSSFVLSQQQHTDIERSMRSAQRIGQLCALDRRGGGDCTGWHITFDDGQETTLRHIEFDGSDVRLITVDLEDGVTTIPVPASQLVRLQTVETDTVTLIMD